MSAANTIFQKSNRGIAALALAVLVLDKFTKWLVLRTLAMGDEKTVIAGFFKLVHWGNTGAAWRSSAATTPRSPWSPCSRSSRCSSRAIISVRTPSPARLPSA